MKIRIKDLEPNPFRDMKNYPINQEKIESLAKSINQTGFWDNILARKRNGRIEIAYGHHRLMVLKREFKPDHVIDIPVKELDDATMIRIMANENGAEEEWENTPAVVDETVKITRNFLRSPEGSKYIKTKTPQFKKDYLRSPLAFQISEFLGGNWSEYWIYVSIKRMEDIKKGELDRKAVESMPHITAADYFTRAVKKHKPNKEIQKKAAQKIIERQDFGESSIHKAVIEEKYPYEEKEQKEKEFAEFIEECSRLINTLNRKLETLINFKSDFDSKYYKETFARFSFDASIDMLRVRLKQLLKEDK